MDSGKMAQKIREVLYLLADAGLETDAVLIKRQRDTEQLGLCDMGDGLTETREAISILPMIRGADRNVVGEIQRTTALGDNPQRYLEFIHIRKPGQTLQIETGNRLLYQGIFYIISECLPVSVDGDVLLEQYLAKAVE